MVTLHGTCFTKEKEKRKERKKKKKKKKKKRKIIYSPKGKRQFEELRICCSWSD